MVEEAVPQGRKFLRMGMAPGFAGCLRSAVPKPGSIEATRLRGVGAMGVEWFPELPTPALPGCE
jgi:hypothetical protein